MAPADFKVDEKKTFTGECVYFNKRGGYGFIQSDNKNACPNGKAHVYWRDINSDDRWPFMYKGLKVTFNLSKFVPKSGKGSIIKARNVSLAGGKKINLQDDLEGKFEYVHSKQTRFTGVVKMYNTTKGAGYITLDDGYAGVDDCPTDLLVVRNEINSGNNAPTLRKGMKVEFGIKKNAKGNFSCYSVTLPGGQDILRTEVEERKSAGNSTFTGEVSFYNNKARYGYITPDNVGKFPASVKKALDESNAKAKAKLEKSGKTKQAASVESLLYFRRGDVESVKDKLWRGSKATFKLYVDNRGAGACNIVVA
jgi:cold shock CspA family protein